MACILCAVMLVTLLPGDIWYNSSAQTGTLNEFVTSVNVYDKNNTKINGDIVLGGNDNFTIEYNFKIPNAEQTYTEGSTIDTYIPTEYCEFANPDKSYDLKGSDGTVIATFTVDTSGHVVITFTAAVEGKSNVEGYFYVGCNLNAENVENNEEIQIDLEIPNKPPITITVNNEELGKTNPYISKSADYSRDFGWQIVVNPGGGTSTQGMKIKDTLVNQIIDGDVKFGDRVLY